MLVESWAIILLILVMSYLFYRSSKKDYALAILPLIIVPFANVISSPVTRFFHGLFAAAESIYVKLALYLLGIVIACVWFGGMAKGIESKIARRSYLLLCTGFSLILTFVFVHEALSTLV